MSAGRPRIAITPGEPAGIGPDICLQVLAGIDTAGIIVVADPELLDRRAHMLGLPLRIVECSAAADSATPPPGSLAVLPVRAADPSVCGRPDPGNVPYLLETLDTAAAGCRDGTFDALVTGPVHKGVINQAGVHFTGHTEYLAGLTGATDVVMMLATAGLRVALATTHLALKDVFAGITPQRIESVLRTTDDGLRQWFGIDQPRLLVCGLNPHAGEQGDLGLEEIEVITPAIEKLVREGRHINGPLPADTAFIPDRLAECDAVVAMYHDQGLPVLKHLGFGNAINVTLGLPIIRTSVDHGTALELAGSGRARTTSMALALDTAVAMVANRDRPLPAQR